MKNVWTLNIASSVFASCFGDTTCTKENKMLYQTEKRSTERVHKEKTWIWLFKVILRCYCDRGRKYYFLLFNFLCHVLFGFSLFPPHQVTLPVFMLLFFSFCLCLQTVYLLSCTYCNVSRCKWRIHTLSSLMAMVLLYLEQLLLRECLLLYILIQNALLYKTIKHDKTCHHRAHSLGSLGGQGWGVGGRNYTRREKMKRKAPLVFGPRAVP